MRLQNRAFKLAFRGADDGPGPWVTLWCGVFKDLFSLAHGPVITDKGCAGYLLLKMFLKPSYKNASPGYCLNEWLNHLGSFYGAVFLY